VNAPEVYGGALSDDTKAIAAARTEFWMRWRGEPPCYAASRRQTARRVQSTEAASDAPTNPPAAPVVSAATHRKGDALLARFERLIEKELARCEGRMALDEWRAHRAWIEEHARGCLWEALAHHAAKETDIAIGRKTGGRGAGVPNKVTADIKALAGQYSGEAVACLVDLMHHAGKEQVRLTASCELWTAPLERRPSAPR